MPSCGSFDKGKPFWLPSSFFSQEYVMKEGNCSKFIDIAYFCFDGKHFLLPFCILLNLLFLLQIPESTDAVSLG